MDRSDGLYKRTFTLALPAGQLSSELQRRGLTRQDAEADLGMSKGTLISVNKGLPMSPSTYKRLLTYLKSHKPDDVAEALMGLSA